jgi:Flp pilus assembly protein TadB
MAQTKRKRQTKHRGNAAGSVTSRGRTSRPPSEKERKARSKEELRQERLNRKPTWKSMAQRAGLASALMFVLLLVVGKGHNVLYAIAFGVVAFALYLPAGYYLEMFFWKRRMRKQNPPRRPAT